MSLAARRDIIDLMLVFKLPLGLVDTDVSRLKILISHYNTRSYGNNNIIVKRARTGLYVGRAFTYVKARAHHFGMIPSSVNASTSLLLSK